jgi:UDP-N-acetyl-D-mannosaminuronic acid dehydrogenase
VKQHLSASINDKTAQVVVLGLGYVGLPVACLFAEAGFPVVGIRRSREKVGMINRGICPIEGKEPGLSELVAQTVTTGRLHATTDYAACREAQIVLIAVETPVDPVTRKPGYEALRGALTDLGRNLSRGTMVIIESTIAPGTMETIVKPMLEDSSGLRVGKDFYLVNCPERVMPGKLLANIRGCHRVVGGMSPEAADLAVAFYRHVVQADLDPVDCLTAETVKTMENAYRDVQIAFANEMALLCENMGADVWQVRELVNKAPYRSMHLPGTGVGGHCIPKDPWLLIANADDGFEPRIIPTAREVNEGMPLHMADLVVGALRETGVGINDARVAVLGYAYLENSDDTRNSPSAVLVERLRELGAVVSVHDPYVPGCEEDLNHVLQGANAVVIAVAHEEYRSLDWEDLKPRLRNALVVDGRNVCQGEALERIGYRYRAIGEGKRGAW